MARKPDAPWYRNPFWGCLGIAISCFLTWLGLVMKVAPWLLFFAWAFCSGSVWIACAPFRRRVLVTGITATVIGIGCVWLHGAYDVKDPHILIKNVSLQPPSEQEVKFLVYVKNEGNADCAVELVDSIQVTDHLATKQHRDEFETYLFDQSAKLAAGRPPSQAIDLRAGEDATFTIQSANIKDIVQRFHNNGVLYLTAVIWYVGRPDLPKVSICRYWTAEPPTEALSCHAHDDVGK